MERIQALTQSDDPTIRYKTRRDVLGEKPRSKGMRALQAAIAETPRVAALLSERNRKGVIPGNPYAKWSGTHWVLYALAELDYPPGDPALEPLRDQQLDWILSKAFENSIVEINGLARIHASMDANAIWAHHVLGLANAGTEKLVARLLRTQWRDGGWNCDKQAKGDTSSFYESIAPLRALGLHSKVTGDPRARAAAERTAEFFLKRKLYKRVRDGAVIKPSFVQLHFPCYWRYDILHGLKVMWEAGWLDDPRCGEALDLLETKELAEGGWAANGKFYRHTRAKIATGRSLIGWGESGGRGKNAPNEYVTVAALTVLKAAGREPKR